MLWLVLLSETFGKDRSQFVSCKNLKESQILPNWYFVALFFNSVTLLILAIRGEILPWGSNLCKLFLISSKLFSW